MLQEGQDLYMCEVMETLIKLKVLQCYWYQEVETHKIEQMRGQKEGKPFIQGV